MCARLAPPRRAGSDTAGSRSAGRSRGRRRLPWACTRPPAWMRGCWPRSCRTAPAPSSPLSALQRVREALVDGDAGERLVAQSEPLQVGGNALVDGRQRPWGRVIHGDRVPAQAKTWAMPCPMRPAPTTATFSGAAPITGGRAGRSDQGPRGRPGRREGAGGGRGRAAARALHDCQAPADAAWPWRAERMSRRPPSDIAGLRVGDRHEHRGGGVGAVLDRARLVRRKVARVHALEGDLALGGDDRDFALEHQVHLLDRRRVFEGAAAGQEVREAHPEVARLADLEALEAQAEALVVLGSLVRRGLVVACDLHHPSLPVARRNSPVGSTMATMRTMQPSPFSQRHGNAAMVTRLPLTLSMSAPQTFSKPTMPLPRIRRWQGSQSGKSSWMGWPLSCSYSLTTPGRSGPGPCMPMAVASGWFRACWSTPTPLAPFSRRYSTALGTRPGE